MIFKIFSILVIGGIAIRLIYGLCMIYHDRNLKDDDPRKYFDDDPCR